MSIKAVGTRNWLVNMWIMLYNVILIWISHVNVYGKFMICREYWQECAGQLVWYYDWSILPKIYGLVTSLLHYYLCWVKCFTYNEKAVLIWTLPIYFPNKIRRKTSGTQCLNKTHWLLNTYTKKTLSIK